MYNTLTRHTAFRFAMALLVLSSLHVRPAVGQAPLHHMMDEKLAAEEMAQIDDPQAIQRGLDMLKRRTDRRAAFLSKNPDFTTQKVLPTPMSAPGLLPVRFSWREKGMVTPVRDQGPNKSCWAFYKVGVAEAMFMIRHRELLDLSEQALIRCHKPKENLHELMYDVGIPPETADTYKGDSTAADTQGCNLTRPSPWHLGADAVKLTPVDGTVPRDVIKRALLDHGPLGTRLHVGNGTSAFHKASGTGALSGTAEGGAHMVVVTGWDDELGAWEIKNSWGTGWRNNGFGWIKYGANWDNEQFMWWVEPYIPPVRVTAVFRKGSSEEKQVYGAEYDAYRKMYDSLWPQGWRLYKLENAVVDGNVLYSAIWRPGTQGEIQLYDATYDAFRAKYDELWNKGWRLYLLNNYEAGGSVRYTAVWRKSTAAEIQLYGATFDEWKQKNDELFPKGWRLQILNTFSVGDQARYTAVWRKGTFGEIHWVGVRYDKYREKYDEIYPAGWRLHDLSNYVVDGVVHYSAVFRKAVDQEYDIYSWEYDDFRAKADDLRKKGWRVGLINTY